MPFFSSKFSPKKTPPRRVGVFLANKNLSPATIEEELGLEIGPIRLKLGDQDATFQAGIWIPESGSLAVTFKENEQLKRDMRQLEEQNNLLKLKFELLLDMLLQTKSELNVQKESKEKHKKNYRTTTTN